MNRSQYAETVRDGRVLLHYSATLSCQEDECLEIFGIHIDPNEPQVYSISFDNEFVFQGKVADYRRIGFDGRRVQVRTAHTSLVLGGAVTYEYQKRKLHT